MLLAAGVAGAAVVLLLPGFATDRLNSRGIAWEAPAGESFRLAEAGLAVTSNEDGDRLTGRDLDTGAQRWRLRLDGDSPFSGQLRVQRAGKQLLVTDTHGVLRAIDARTGRQAWAAEPASFVLPAVAGAGYVAVTRCDVAIRCTVESRSLADGKIRWSARVDGVGPTLGSPLFENPQSSLPALWPASYAIVREPPDGARYSVRALATGEVLARGDEDDEAGVIGDVFVRRRRSGLMTGTDLSTGREAWRRSESGVHALRAFSARWGFIGMPGGGVVLDTDAFPLPFVEFYDVLLLLDPQTGKTSEHKAALGSGSGTVIETGPPVDGAAPRTPALRSNDPDDPVVIADGRTYRLGGSAFSSSITATPGQVAWSSETKLLGGRDGRVVEVRDRRSGERVARFRGEDVRVRAVGERIVISADDGERQLVVTRR